MRNIVLGAALLISGLMGASANAMPLAQPLARDTTDIQAVDYACGRGYHLSPRGFCRPNGPPRYEREWGGRGDWEARREWRERQARREWHERRAWEREREWRRGGYDYRDRW
ncbi:UNVERIFIED_ORG: hypothetical protein J2W66_004454 [Agrobacterium larrymoorei]|uniref:Uncharacterized protein n=1 Tax=Agrobacterium cavarae TaxID=2528239 RepID=A0ABY1YD35_9HYPH|nr:hypothetical protein [Agrobacterium larrymoorei]TBN18433.1 hypothetical protein EYC79_01835 [Agrobacterium cavarae]